MIKENLFYAKERMELLLNIDEIDKKKFEGLYAWCPRAMELSIKEKNINIIPEEGEIWTCDFGINVGSEIDKIRPCYIASRYFYNKGSNVVSVMPITHTTYESETHILLDSKYFLFKNDIIVGTIKVEQERSLSKSRFGKKIGKLNEEGIKAVKKAVLIHHNINDELIKELYHKYNDNDLLTESNKESSPIIHD